VLFRSENYRETVFSFAQQPRSYDAPYSQGHFLTVPNVVFHMRTGELGVVGGGRTFHVGEIQSDLGRDLRDVAQNTRAFNRPLNMSPLEWQLSLRQRNNELLVEGRRLSGEMEALRKRPQTSETDEQIRLLQDQRERTAREAGRTARVLDSIQAEGDATQTFGLPTYGARFPLTEGTNVRGPVPIAKDTSDYNTIAIARAFSDATESGADFLTFNTGDMMHEFSGGLLSGQRKAYDDILPRDVQTYLRRLSDEYGVDVPAIEQVTIAGGDQNTRLVRQYTVPGVRLTPELKSLIQEYGLPSYNRGGIVSLLHNQTTRRM
jgi:hypothetical protein